MNIIFHELFHLLLALIPPIVIIKYHSKRSSLLLAGLIGGFFIDLDHLIDYVLAFGLKFRLDYFIKGYQFLKSDKIYVFFHSYELIMLLLLTSFIIQQLSLRGVERRSNPVKNNLIFISLLTLTLASSMLLHVIFDIVENELPPATYSLTYRLKNNFDTKNLVYPDHYRYHLEQKKKIKLE